MPEGTGISIGSPFGALDMARLGFSRVTSLSGRGNLGRRLTNLSRVVGRLPACRPVSLVLVVVVAVSVRPNRRAEPVQALVSVPPGHTAERDLGTDCLGHSRQRLAAAYRPLACQAPTEGRTAGSGWGLRCPFCLSPAACRSALHSVVCWPPSLRCGLSLPPAPVPRALPACARG